jgi:hypothetical protein
VSAKNAATLLYRNDPRRRPREIKGDQGEIKAIKDEDPRIEPS